MLQITFLKWVTADDDRDRVLGGQDEFETNCIPPKNGAQ